MVGQTPCHRVYDRMCNRNSSFQFAHSIKRGEMEEYGSKSKVDKGSQSQRTVTVTGPEVKCCFLTQLNFREGHQDKRPKRYHVPFSRFSRRPRPTRTRRAKSRFKLSRKWGALFRQSLRISGARFRVADYVP